MKKRNNLLQILGVFYLVMAVLSIFGIIDTNSIWGILIFVLLAIFCLYAGAAKIKAEEARNGVVKDKNGKETVKVAEPQLSSGTLRKMKKERKL